MKKTIFFCIGVVLLSFQFSSSQTLEELRPNVMPASPTASAFLKYGEYPVSKYTGVPKISIPIFNIEEKGLKIPITLNYHAGGIRVSEEATWVGLGWSLNTGGQISQIVLGYDDEGSKSIELPNYPENSSQNCADHQLYLQLGRDILPSIYQGQGLRDTQPDIFKYSFLGTSGSFILDPETKEPVSLSDRTSRIEKFGNGFRIINVNGDIGEFSVKERNEIEGIYSYSKGPTGHDSNGLGSLSGTTEGSFLSASNSYYLSKIISGKSPKNQISYSYDQTERLYAIPSISQSIDFNTVRIITLPECCSVVPPLDKLHTSLNVTAQRYQYLKTISYNNGNMVLNFYTSERDDFVGNRKLDKIEVLYKSKIIKTINFNYGYYDAGSFADFGSASMIEQLASYKTKDELRKRLKLDSLQILGEPPYVFEYDETELPPKTSYGTDYWGFYNGKTSNKSFIPNIRRFKMELNDEKFGLIKNNKSSSEQYAKACMLKSITYPLRGKTTFDFELHEFSNFEVPDIDFDETDVFNTVSVSDLNSTSTNDPEKRIKILYFDEIKYLQGTASTFVPPFSNCHLNSGIFRNTGFWIKAYPISLKQEYEQNPEQFRLNYINGAYTQIPGGDGVSSYAILNTSINTNSASEKFTHEFKPEYLYVIEAFNGDGCEGVSVSGGIKVPVDIATLPINLGISKGGGLRIKTITNLDNNDIQTVNNYDYFGGKAMVDLKYLKATNWVANNNLKNDPLALKYYNFKKSINSSSYLPLSANSSGNYIGYNMVTEKNVFLNNNDELVKNNGKIIEYYINKENRTLFSEHHLINIPPIKNLSENGSLLRREVFDKDDTKVLQVEMQYQYESDGDDQCYYGMTYASQERKVTQTDLTIDIVYETAYYPINRTKNLLLESKTINYYSEGNIVKTFNYEYNDNYLIKKSIESSSINSNKDFIREYYYPYDIENDISSMPFMEDLRIQNRIGVPVLEKSYRGLNLIFEKLTHYDNSFDSEQVFPSFIEINKNNILEERIRYINYDKEGNLLEYTISDDAHIIYVWGYNKQYPVAKIINASYIGISTTARQAIAAAISASDADISSTTEKSLIDKLEILRSDPYFSNSQITTYTYDPLVGVTSVTDPSGYILTYEYDDFQRLKFVKDNEGKILSENQYHYKND